MANKELLHKVLEHIKSTPDEYDPVRWHKDFAGWTLRLAMPGVEARRDEACDVETLFDADGVRIWIADIGPMAKVLLGLKPSQASRLFCAANTIDDLAALVAEFTASEASA
jgi:hypothetical protein